jgi:hypothetical protein
VKKLPKRKGWEEIPPHVAFNVVSDRAETLADQWENLFGKN